jgi:hypothetical protein
MVIFYSEKFNPEKTMSVVYWDNEQGFYYVNDSDRSCLPIAKPQNFIGEVSDNKLVSITWSIIHDLKLNLEEKTRTRE